MSRRVSPTNRMSTPSPTPIAIRSASIGPAFYPPDVVAAWAEGLAGDVYRQAMAGGEVFFVATGPLEGATPVLGFASDYLIEGATHGTSAYVRGAVARQGIGSLLLRLAEAHAIGRGAMSLSIESSLAAVAFYQRHGFVEVSRGRRDAAIGASNRGGGDAEGSGATGDR